MKKIILFFLLGLALTAGEITIAVAANVSYAIDDLKQAFTKHHPDTKIRVILGSSGKLTAQIRNGAPYGLFMSADMAYPKILYKEGIAVTKPAVYAKGMLALFSPKPRDFSKGLKLLENPAIRRIAIANPNTAPYGKAALEALKKSGVYDRVKEKLIYAESVSQTVAYTMTAADAGFIAKSSLFSPKMRKFRERTHWVTVDPSFYHPIDQGIVLLKNGMNDKRCRDFYDFILSDEARSIFRRYGYRVP